MPRHFDSYETTAKWIDEHIGVCIVCLGTVEDLSRTGLCFICDAKWCRFFNSLSTKEQTSDRFFGWLNSSITGLDCAECGAITDTPNDYLCTECREIMIQAEDNTSE